MSRTIGCLKIGYQDYRIEIHDDLGDEICGDTDLENSVIRIAESAIDRQRNTVIHEVLHAIWDQMGLNAQLSDNIQEQVVTSLSNGISTLLADNPQVIVLSLKDADGEEFFE